MIPIQFICFSLRNEGVHSRRRWKTAGSKDRQNNSLCFDKITFECGGHILHVHSGCGCIFMKNFKSLSEQSGVSG
jgi:hypothetical protein